MGGGFTLSRKWTDFPVEVRLSTDLAHTDGVLSTARTHNAVLKRKWSDGMVRTVM